MRVNWRAAKNSKQRAQRVAVCLTEGPVFLFPLLLWGAIQPAQPAGTERKHGGLSKFSDSECWASSTAAFWGEIFFPCVDGSQLKPGPCYVDTAGWRGNHLQRPSTMTKWNEKYPHMRCNARTRHSGSSSSEHHIQHWTARVLHYIAHADISRYEPFPLVLGDTGNWSCLS